MASTSSTTTTGIHAGTGRRWIAAVSRSNLDKVPTILDAFVEYLDGHETVAAPMTFEWRPGLSFQCDLHAGVVRIRQLDHAEVRSRGRVDVPDIRG
jgi:hypothetical protein